jgi:beta-lactamase regulating signal transducer with metallopeptidase domain
MAQALSATPAEISVDSFDATTGAVSFHFVGARAATLTATVNGMSAAQQQSSLGLSNVTSAAASDTAAPQSATAGDGKKNSGKTTVIIGVAVAALVLVIVVVVVVVVRRGKAQSTSQTTSDLSALTDSSYHNQDTTGVLPATGQLAAIPLQERSQSAI